MGSRAGLETEPLLPTEKTKTESRLSQYLAFVGLGLGPCWALVNSFYLEMPWFEDTQPEGLQLSTWLGLPNAVATLLFMIVVVDGRMIQFIPKLVLPTVALAILVNVL